MKIISKFKDFYDHKVAKYGIDPVLVFDRRHPSDAEILHSLPKPPAEWEEEYGACAAVSVLYVGRLRVYLFNTGARVYTSFDVAEVFRRTQPHFSRDVCPKIRFNDGGEYYLPKYADYLLSADEKFQAETNIHRNDLLPLSRISLTLSLFQSMPYEVFQFELEELTCLYPHALIEMVEFWTKYVV